MLKQLNHKHVATLAVTLTALALVLVGISIFYTPQEGVCSIGEACALEFYEVEESDWVPQFSLDLVYDDEILIVDDVGNVTVGQYDNADVERVAAVWCNLPEKESARTTRQLSLAVLRLSLNGFTKAFDSCTPTDTTEQGKR